MCDFIYSPGIRGLVAKEGLELVAEGHDKHTRWFVADSTVEKRKIRHVILRGVVWNDDEVDRVSLMQRLATIWPRVVENSESLQCHSGVYQIAEEVWTAVLPYIQSRPTGSSLCFAGHSLGGSLALILASFARLKLSIPPAAILPIHLFGSPPVMTLSRSEGAATSTMHDSAALMRELHLPEDGVRWFVADTDVIPRMWNSVDPVYSFVRRSDVAVRLMNWRQQFFGGAVLTEQKFLYDTVGRIYWIRWDRIKGVMVTLLTPEQAAVELAQEPEDFIQPSALFRSAMDHNRRNYTHALESLVTLHKSGV